MRVLLNAMGVFLIPGRYKGAVRVFSCIFISLFLVSCVDGISIPDFPQIKKQSADKTASSKNESDDSGLVLASVKKIKTETLLATDGNWNLVEKSEAIDPMQAHLAARKDVNVKRRKNKKELSAHFKPNAKSGEDGKMRVLRLEADDSTFEDYEIAQSSISKPTQTVVENDILNKIKSLFGDDDSNSQGIIIPKRKPVLGLQEDDRGKVASAKTPKSTEERMVGGVVLPPELPARKAGKIVTAVVKVPVKTLSKNVTVIKDGVIVPKRKPSRNINLAARSSNKPLSRPPLTKKPKQKNYISQGSNTARAAVIRLRSGKHPGKTRLVIEVNRVTKYKVIIDHVRNVLRIKLYDTKWTLSPQESFTKSALLGTYVAREQKDGSVILEVRMKKKTKILDTVILRPNISSKHRVVIDLKD